MRNFHIVLGADADLARIAAEAAQGLRPGHLMWDLSRRLGAQIHRVGAESPSIGDALRARIFSQASFWGAARGLAARLGRHDVVYCLGEEIGIPLAAHCGGRPDGPRIATLVANIDRPRGRAALRLFGTRDRIDLYLAVAPGQAAFLQDRFGLPDDRVQLIDDQTDADFFTPGPTAAARRRPLLASGGLERRDYVTLAAAAGDMDVDIEICAYSPNADRLRSAFPEEMPRNMTARFYDWVALRQLYRDADVFVLPLIPNNYSAGLTTLLEAMACRRPVVATRIPGPIVAIEAAGAVTTVPAGDAPALRAAIVHLLENPGAAAEQAERAYELVQRRFNKMKAVESLASILTAL